MNSLLDRLIHYWTLFAIGVGLGILIVVVSLYLSFATADILVTDTDGNQKWVTETGTGFNVVDMGGGGITQITRTGNGYVTIPPKGPASITQFGYGTGPNYVTDQNMIWQELNKPEEAPDPDDVE